MEEPKYHLEGVLHPDSEEPDDFDGPLDVILLLLSKNKIEIEDIKIASILEQYLDYLDEMKRMDMEIASEFIAMASRLKLIKTKMLLSITEQAEAQSEMEQLIQSLQERQRKEAYAQIRTACDILAARNEIGCSIFIKEPEPIQRDQTYRYQHDRMDLAEAMAELAERSESALPPVHDFKDIVRAEPYPVVAKAKELIRRLVVAGVAKFRSLFRGNRTRSEIVATFLAILELCNLRSISVQEDEKNELTVKYIRMPEGAEADVKSLSDNYEE